MGGAWGNDCSGEQGKWSTEGTIWGMLALCTGIRASYPPFWCTPFAIPSSALLTRGGSHTGQVPLRAPSIALFVALSLCTTSYISPSLLWQLHPWLALKHSLHCCILRLRNFVKKESVCRVKSFPFSWPGLIYQRYFAVATKLFSEKEHRAFFPRAIGPANILAIDNLTKHRMFLPK